MDDTTGIAKWVSAEISPSLKCKFSVIGPAYWIITSSANNNKKNPLTIEKAHSYVSHILLMTLEGLPNLFELSCLYL